MGISRPSGVKTHLRKKVLERDNHKCQKCGKKYNYLQIHHIKSVIEGGTDDLDNLITLCGTCHRHAPYNKEKFKEYCADKLPPNLKLIKGFSKVWALSVLMSPDFKNINSFNEIEQKLNPLLNGFYLEFWESIRDIGKMPTNEELLIISTTLAMKYFKTTKWEE